MSNAWSQENSWAGTDVIQAALLDKQNIKGSDSYFAIISVRTPATGAADPGDAREIRQ